MINCVCVIWPIAPWEKFRFNPTPSRQQLEALATVVEVEAERLQEM
ncbi:hypothetical protein [Microcoleus vaginatus]